MCTYVTVSTHQYSIYNHVATVYIHICQCCRYVPNAPRSPPHVYRSWCPDRTLAQARKYIADAMGARYAESVILDLEETWGESNPRTPLICFLSMGSDPTNAIEGLSKKLKLECRAISMGQGQEVHARRLLLQSMTEVGGRDHE